MRPHTHTYPKALLYVGGKAILGHILDEVRKLGITDVVLILGYMGTKIKEYVEAEYKDMNFVFAQQEKRLGLGHAIKMAEPFVKDDEPVLIIYGDTIFVGDISSGLKSASDACLGVKTVDDPRRFGVVEMDGGKAKKLVEKPDYIKPMPVIVGVNFVKNSGLLFACLNELVEKDIRTKGEYQLTDAFQLMIDKGAVMTTFELDGWYDCGKPETMLATNRYLLSINSQIGKPENCIIIEPVFIDEKANVTNSIIGPNTTIAKGAIVENSIIENSILNANCKVSHTQLNDSLIGESAIVEGKVKQLNVGDNSEVRFS